MGIDESVKQLNEFILAYEKAKDTMGKEKLLHVKRDYEATKVVLKEYNNLVKEVSNLAIESIKREKELAKLEAEVRYLRNYLLREGFIV